MCKSCRFLGRMHLHEFTAATSQSYVSLTSLNVSLVSRLSLLRCCSSPCPHLHLYFFSFLATQQHMEVPCQGSDPSCSCDPSRSCSNARSLTHCARPGIEHALQRSKDDADPRCATAGTPPPLNIFLSLLGVLVPKWLGQ